MTQDPHPPSPKDLQLELSHIQTSLAMDRTLLAWVRTSLSLSAFGFTLAKFVHYLISKGYLYGVVPEVPRLIGLGLMALGLLCLLCGAFDHYRSIKRLSTVASFSPWSASLVVSLILAVINLLLMISLLTELRAP
jgi:putative membrane protein